MKLSAAELLKKIEQGEDLETISLSLISEAEQGLLKCCAVVRAFDETLVDKCFRPHVSGADKETVPFARLTSFGFVQRIPRTEGEYSLQPIMQKKYYDAWWDAPDVPRSDAPPALKEVTKDLIDHYQTLGEAGKLDLIAQQVFLDKDKACDLFKELYKAADDAFDLAACRDIINVLKGRENVLGAEFSKALNDTDRYLQSRGLWATEYYQAVSYYEREEIRNKLETFLAESDKHDPLQKWILHLHAPGGMGKTMFVRWLISRRCVPHPYTIPCGRIDFDFVDRITSSQHRWLLFLDMARDLEVQIPGNFFHSLIGKFTDYERILSHQETQQTTSTVATQLPPREKLEEEMLYLFSSALNNASLGKPIILILDTLEEVILYRPDDLVELVRQVRTVRKSVPDVLLVLSGRYPLTKNDDETDDETETAIRLPQFDAEFGKLTKTIRVKPFADLEALGFLQEKKKLTKDRPLDIVVERSEGNPFKLALFADILLDDPEITADTIRDYPSADLLYLIERVLARIPNKTLHWLLRYGVVPRKLTRSFVEAVLKDHLLRAISGDASQDDPRRYVSLTKKAQATVQNKEIFVKDTSVAATQTIDVNELWTQLQNYASTYAWVTMEPSDPYTVAFHSDVLNPMRRWLEEEPVYELIHRDAIKYFETKAQAEPKDWAKWMRNAVYHKFQLEGATAAGYWRQLIQGADEPARRRELAAEIIGLEYVDENLKPLLLLNGREIITVPTLVEAYYELARACVGMAREQNVSASDQLWSDADYDLQKSEQLQQTLPETVIQPAYLTAVRAAILTSQGLGDQAIPILQEQLQRQPDDRARVRLETELANAFASRKSYLEAGSHWESALAEAERIGSSPKFILETRRRLARLHREELNLQASSMELEKALSFISPDDVSTKYELLSELADTYFDMGQFSRARKTFEDTRGVYEQKNAFVCQLRDWNYLTRFHIASGNPIKAVDSNRQSQASIADSGPNSVADESRDLYNVAVVEAQEQSGILKGLLFEFEEAREALELARSRWRELGNSRAVKRCMLKKAEVWLKGAGDFELGPSVLDEATRLSIETDVEQLLEQELLRLTEYHFTDYKDHFENALHSLEEKAEQEKWKSPHLAKLKLGTGVWTIEPKNSNQFFSDLTELFQQIEPPSARMLLLDPLTEYPRCKVSAKVANAFIALFPLDEEDPDYAINAPKVAEVLRVLGRKTKALDLLANLLKAGSSNSTYALRRVLLTHGRTSPGEGSADYLKWFVDTFVEEFQAFPVLCGSTLVELAEVSFGAHSKTRQVELLNKAEEFLNRKGFDSQWMMRLLWLRGKLTIEPDRVKALEDLKRAGTIAETLGNRLAFASLNSLIAKESAKKVRPGGDFLTKGIGRVADELEELKPTAEDKPPLGTLPNTTTIHVKENWVDTVTIETITPGKKLATRQVPITPDSLLDQLLAFETYENYSFSFLKQMDSNWIAACIGLGRIMLNEMVGNPLQQSSDQQQALCLVIDALQLSAPPWEMMVTSPDFDYPASISPEFSYFYRSVIANPSRNVAETIWMQAALSRLMRESLVADGSYGPKTQDAVSRFQREHNLPDHGLLDGQTRRALKNALHAEAGRERPRILLLRPSIERQRATSRGKEVFGFSPEDWYRRESFRDVMIVEDPDQKKLESILFSFEPDVVHIFSTMEESPSVGIYLDFGSRGTGDMPSRRVMKSAGPKRSASSGGEVEFITLSFLAEMMRRQQKRDRPRPLLVLDVLEPPGTTDLFTQLFLRNAFAAQLYPLGCFESIIATGLTPAEIQERTSRTLISALGSFESVGKIVNLLRRSVELGSYTRLADVGETRGPLRDPADRRYLSSVTATAATVLFTQDPEM